MVLETRPVLYPLGYRPRFGTRGCSCAFHPLASGGYLRVSRLDDDVCERCLALDGVAFYDGDSVLATALGGEMVERRGGGVVGVVLCGGHPGCTHSWGG